MSISADWDRPAPADASTKTTSATSISTLRLTRSASLPQMGVEMAVVSRVMVMTQVYCVCVPPRSSTMMGIDEPTTVIESIEQNMANRRPESASSFWRVAFFSLSVVKRVLPEQGCRKL